MSWRRLAAVGAVLLVVAAAFAGYVTFVDPYAFSDDPGDCGLGTGGVYPVNDTGQRVGTSAAAERVVRGALRGNTTGYVSELLLNASRYGYLPREDVSDRFDEAVRASVENSGFRGRAAGYEFDGTGRVYYFVPGGNATAFTHYRRTVFVAGNGEVFLVRIGAC